MASETVIRNFWSRVNKETQTFCWAWTGRKNESGYGLLGRLRAHRLSYEIHKGPIPDGMFVCHRCDNPQCCNPDHLFLGRAYENNIDRVIKRRLVRVSPALTRPKREMYTYQKPGGKLNLDTNGKPLYWD